MKKVKRFGVVNLREDCDLAQEVPPKRRLPTMMMMRRVNASMSTAKKAFYLLSLLGSP
jgi:hypothetical protein